ncbi:MAG: YicC family protein [Lentisphaeria bacterium]|nr:YicC family protein [Lentisphaeria bacterium]
MNSMTGFGRGAAEHDGHTVTVEVTAVNGRKQADVRLVLPRELATVEAFVKGRVQQAVRRGNVTVAVSYSLSPDLRSQTVLIDTDVALRVAGSLRQLARSAGIPEDIRLGDLLQVPGIVTQVLPSPAAALQPILGQALDQALDGLNAARRAEGTALQHDLRRRCRELTGHVESVAARADAALVQHRDHLRDRIALLGVDLALDDERLAREVAFCAEKADVTEEVVRLRSHLAQFGALLDVDRDVGREMEFLCQEMSREANTIGAKTSDTVIAEVVIALKADLARLREQVMNVE